MIMLEQMRIRRNNEFMFQLSAAAWGPSLIVLSLEPITMFQQGHGKVMENMEN